MKKRTMLSVSENYSSPLLTTTPTTENIPAIVVAVASPDATQQLEAVVQLRKLLSIEKNPPIEQILATNVLPQLIQLLGSTNSKMQFEAAWAITNIASGTSEQTQKVVQAGGVQAFIYLLGSPDAELREQAVWALGNIAGDSAQCRDYVLQNNILTPLLQILESEQKQTMLRNSVWALSNLCRGKPQPNFAVIASAVPALARLLHSDDSEILTDALWAFSYLSDASDEQVESLLGCGFASRVVELLSHSSHTIQTPALRIVGNIVTGSDKITQSMLNLGILRHLNTLLQSSRKALRKEAAWTVSNITAGNTAQTQSVIEAQIMPLIVNLLRTGDFDVKKECAWALSNASSHKKDKHIKYLSDIGAISPMCSIMDHSDPKVITIGLEFIENVLATGAQAKCGNPYVSIIEECDGLEVIEKLQTHASEAIYERAQKLLENYFDAEDVDENADVGNSQGFTFAAPQAPSHFVL